MPVREVAQGIGRTLATAAAIALLWGSTAWAQECENPDSLTFAMIPTEETVAELELYKPVTDRMASETGKKARLQLRMAGSSDQLDRNVLERITAPLEHMLRNAVDHGIELPGVRESRGKPAVGCILVECKSRGSVTPQRRETWRIHGTVNRTR